MISRWDARVNRAIHHSYDSVPISVVFRCERCGSVEFYLVEPTSETWNDPCDISRMFVLRCARCRMLEVTPTRTVMLGAY